MFREIRHVTRLGSFTSSVNMNFAKLQSGFMAGLVKVVKMILISRWGILKRHTYGKTRFKLGPYDVFFALLVVPNISVSAHFFWSFRFFLTLIRADTIVCPRWYCRFFSCKMSSN
jgi:hypothetical protein